MADITNPQVVKFTNEHIRPLSEQVRDLKAYIDDAAATYTAEIAGLLTVHVGADVLDDGRENEGVSRLAKSDIQASLVALNSIKTLLDGAGVMDDIRKPTVRPLQG